VGHPSQGATTARKKDVAVRRSNNADVAPRHGLRPAAPDPQRTAREPKKDSASESDTLRLKRELRDKLLRAEDPGAQVQALRALGLKGADLSKLTKGKNPATFAGWVRGDAAPAADDRDRLDDGRYAAASLLDDQVAFTPDALIAWMRVRSKALDGKRPLEALADGEFESVVKAGLRASGR
jgi:hypothetical protein